jgi:hypothetical protein
MISLGKNESEEPGFWVDRVIATHPVTIDLLSLVLFSEVAQAITHKPFQSMTWFE